MSSRRHRNDRSYFSISVGWVFADLLLALAMLFLLANTFGIPKPTKPKPTPTPIPTMIPTPSPTHNALLLQQHRWTLTLSVDNPNSLQNGDTGAKAALSQEIRAKITGMHLQSRRAGFAIVYGGAHDDGQIGEAEAIAQQTYNVLDDLGRQKFVFCGTLHYDTLYVLGGSLTTVVIDFYLFDPSVPNCQSFP